MLNYTIHLNTPPPTTVIVTGGNVAIREGVLTVIAPMPGASPGSSQVVFAAPVANINRVESSDE